MPRIQVSGRKIRARACPTRLAAAKEAHGGELKKTLVNLVGHLAGQPKDSKLLVHKKPLEAAIAAYTGPLADEEKALAARAAAWVALGVERKKWLPAYDALAGDLRAMFPGRKAFVDGFFSRWTTVKAREKAVEPG